MFQENFLDWCLRNSVCPKLTTIELFKVEQNWALVKKMIGPNFFYKKTEQGFSVYLVLNVAEADNAWQNYLKNQYNKKAPRELQVQVTPLIQTVATAPQVMPSAKQSKKQARKKRQNQNESEKVIIPTVIGELEDIKAENSLVQQNVNEAFVFFKKNIAPHVLLPNLLVYPTNLTFSLFRSNELYKQGFTTLVFEVKRFLNFQLNQNQSYSMSPTLQHFIAKSHFNPFNSFLLKDFNEITSQTYSLFHYEIFFIAFHVCTFKIFPMTAFTQLNVTTLKSKPLTKPSHFKYTPTQISMLSTLVMYLWVNPLKHNISNICVILSKENINFLSALKEALRFVLNRFGILKERGLSTSIGLTAEFFKKGCLINLCWLLLRLYNPTILNTKPAIIKTLITQIITLTKIKTTYRYILLLLETHEASFLSSFLQQEELNFQQPPKQAVLKKTVCNTLHANTYNTLNALSSYAQTPLKKKANFLTLKTRTLVSRQAVLCHASGGFKFEENQTSTQFLISTLHLGAKYHTQKHMPIQVNSLLIKEENQQTVITQVTLTTKIDLSITSTTSYDNVYINLNPGNSNERILLADYIKTEGWPPFVFVNLYERQNSPSDSNLPSALIFYYIIDLYDKKRSIATLQNAILKKLQQHVTQILQNQQLQLPFFTISYITKTIAYMDCESFCQQQLKSKGLSSQPLRVMIEQNQAQLALKQLKKRQLQTWATCKIRFVQTERLHSLVKAFRGYLAFFVRFLPILNNLIITGPKVFNGNQGYDSAADFIDTSHFFPRAEYQKNLTFMENIKGYYETILQPKVYKNAVEKSENLALISEELPEVWIKTSSIILKNYFHLWLDFAFSNVLDDKEMFAQLVANNPQLANHPNLGEWDPKHIGDIQVLISIGLGHLQKINESMTMRRQAFFQASTVDYHNTRTIVSKENYNTNLRQIQNMTASLPEIVFSCIVMCTSIILYPAYIALISTLKEEKPSTIFFANKVKDFLQLTKNHINLQYTEENLTQDFDQKMSKYCAEAFVTANAELKFLYEQIAQIKVDLHQNYTTYTKNAPSCDEYKAITNEEILKLKIAEEILYLLAEGFTNYESLKITNLNFFKPNFKFFEKTRKDMSKEELLDALIEIMPFLKCKEKQNLYLKTEFLAKNKLHKAQTFLDNFKKVYEEESKTNGALHNQSIALTKVLNNYKNKVGDRTSLFRKKTFPELVELIDKEVPQQLTKAAIIWRYLSAKKIMPFVNLYFSPSAPDYLTTITNGYRYLDNKTVAFVLKQVKTYANLPDDKIEEILQPRATLQGSPDYVQLLLALKFTWCELISDASGTSAPDASLDASSVPDASLDASSAPE